MNNHNKLVADQYDIIYKEFDTSRVRIWNCVKEFLNNTNVNETLLDCGCGNGKNMIYAKALGYKCKGFDISMKLLNICKEKDLDVFYNDILNINLNENYNKIISIAVLHHLETINEQQIAIDIMLKHLKPGGKLLVSFWSHEKSYNKNGNNKSDTRDFIVGPNYVDWKLNKNNVIKRYYYIHDFNSIETLAKKFNIKYDIIWEMQNWFITFHKKMK
tara:strand:- start:4822 stop:5469 length:648 start_codon:yes stop_codon:yes gene_type:complete